MELRESNVRADKGPVTAWIIALASLLLVLAAYKLLPGQLPNAQSMVGDAAYAQCLRDTRQAGAEGCLGFGYPRGSPKSFGLPASIAADRIFGWDGRVEPEEVRTVYAGFIALSFALACLLFRRMSGSWWLGILGAVLYLLAPVVQQQSGYAALQLGLALIPGYLLFDVLLLEAFRQRRIPLAIGLLAAVAMLRTFALFLDGYSFLFGCALTAVYFTFSAFSERGARKSAVLALLVHVACSGLAAWAYRQYMPSTALAVMPTDFFRGAGVDLLTMLVPLQWQGLHGLARLGLDIQPEMSYGGRASLLGTFTGYSYLLALLAVAWCAARRRMAPGALATAVLLAGLVATLLSLGPSLKFNDFRSDQDRGSALRFNAYLMPEEEATLPLHTAWVYQHVPGIRNARVLARWQVLTRLALVVAMLLALGMLWRSGRRGAAALLALVAFLEIAPNPLTIAEEGTRARDRAQLIHGVYAAEFATLVQPGQRVFLLQLHENASGNQYAANTLCAVANARCYNTGGDKAMVVVEAEWPDEFLALKRRMEVGRNLEAAFEQDLVDVVVVPHFDLRYVVYPRWPNTVEPASVRETLQREIAGMQLIVENGKDFTVVRAGMAGPDRSPD